MADDADGVEEEKSIDVEMLDDDEPIAVPAEVARPVPPPRTVPPPPRAAPPPPPPRATIAIPPPRPSAPSGGIPRPPVSIPRVPPHTPAAIPVVSVPPLVPSPAPDAVVSERMRRPSAPPPVPEPERPRRISQPPPPPVAPPPVSTEDVLAGVPDLAAFGAGVEVSTATPNIVVELPLDAQIEHPTVVDKAIEALGEAGGEARADAMGKQLDALVLADPNAAATLAYELGELYEGRLADEARAVKAFGRALGLDPSLRANLWSIRRVFYRRALWPNLVKLVDAEVAYARDDVERADLLLEKARIAAHRMNQLADARAALDEAVRIAPQHQGALLELERVLVKQGDVPALLESWELLAEAAEQPARKIAYGLEVGRAAAAARDLGRAQEAFERAAKLATGADAERVARERLRVLEQADATPADLVAAIDALAAVLLASFGPSGPNADAMAAPAGERPDRAASVRLELVALRRRQAQLVRADAPDRAWELLQQASALAPGESIVLSDLTELAEELGRYDDLAELVQSWQAVEGDPARAMALSIRRVDALLRGGQRDQARALLASVEATAPGFVVLASAAERDALARKDPADLAKAYLSAAHAALLGTWLGPGQAADPDPHAAAALFVQAADLLAYEVASAEPADAYTEARAALGKALEAVQDYPAAVEAIVELDAVFGHAADALARLRALAAHAEGAAKRPMLERAIRVARSAGDLEAVLGFERELVALVPDETALAWRLEATLAQLGRDEERAELLAQIAARETDGTRRGTALFAAAQLRERAGAVEAASALYRGVLALWPDDTFARESLVDLLRAQEQWAELVAERRAEAKAAPDGPAARRAFREAAWVLEIRLGDIAGAAAVYAEWVARSPSDRSALEGLARTRAATGDHRGAADARRTIAEIDPSPAARWQLAETLERAGGASEIDAAVEQYRALIAGETSAAAVGAALALGDLAAVKGDVVMRVEATAAIASKTADPRLGSALAEHSGWMYALVLEDFDRAAQSFAAAIELGSRRGALLGAALVAARQNDAAALARAYDGLASSVQMPEAAAALLLRASAMAAADGDLDTANARVTAARAAAPDDASTLLVIAETGGVPQVDGDDAFAAVDPLLARAEVLEMRGALADDPDARAAWELDRAEALELAGRLREAGTVVAAVLKQRPDDLRALAALRRMAARAGDKATAANAAFALARVLGDSRAKLDLLREAASAFDGPQGIARNLDYAIATYRRILAIEPGAPELARLLEHLRERADVRGVLTALTDRLTWLDDEGAALPSGGEDPLAPLLFERATVLQGLGDRQAAMTDLDVLLDRSPKHVEALRLRAELAVAAGDVAHAVALWRRYLGVETRIDRRSEIELQLSQVLAENTGDLAGAIEQLERVVAAKPDDAQLRERLLGLCMRASDWERALIELRELVRMRPANQEKAREELRIGQLLRDRIGDRAGARLAFDRARGYDPLNLDAVRELIDLLDPAPRAAMLGQAAQSLRAAIAQTPRQTALYERLAQVHAWQADVDARWGALVAVEALGNPTGEQRQVLAQGRNGLGAPHRGKLDDKARVELRGGFTGPLVELWRAIAPAVQVATGVDAAKLGFARGDRIAVKKLGTQYESLAIALGAFGLDDVDVYINAGRAGFARALAGETPVLLLGADIAAARTPPQRFALGRAVAHAAEGIAPLTDLHDRELASTLVAALGAAEARVPAALLDAAADQDAAIAERTKVLKKQMSRKARAIVQQVAQRPDDVLAVDALQLAALGAGQRAALLWSGDLAAALSVLDVGKGGRALIDSPSALDLVAWSVSEQHLKLRGTLGLAIPGAR